MVTEKRKTHRIPTLWGSVYLPARTAENVAFALAYVAYKGGVPIASLSAPFARRMLRQGLLVVQEHYYGDYVHFAGMYEHDSSGDRAEVSMVAHPYSEIR